MKNFLLEKKKSSKQNSQTTQTSKNAPPKPSVSTKITIAPLALVFEYNCCYK